MKTSPPRVRRRNSVLDVLEFVRREHPDLTPTGLILFLYIAENPGVTPTELAGIARTTLASASRLSRALLAKDHPEAMPPSLGLVDSRPGPDPRVRNLVLSGKGRALCEEVDRRIVKAITIATDS